LVNEFLNVPVPGLWAAGDCAAVPDRNTRTFYPPTAQHGVREGLTAAKNIEDAIIGRPPTPFVFKTLGQLATIGHRTGVVMVFGIKFSGIFAWWLWRTVYLLKLPGLAKKLQVAMGWSLDLLFGREIEQLITLRDIETLSDLLSRSRLREKNERNAALVLDDHEDVTSTPGWPVTPPSIARPVPRDQGPLPLAKQPNVRRVLVKRLH